MIILLTYQKECYYLRTTKLNKKKTVWNKVHTSMPPDGRHGACTGRYAQA